MIYKRYGNFPKRGKWFPYRVQSSRSDVIQAFERELLLRKSFCGTDGIHRKYCTCREAFPICSTAKRLYLCIKKLPIVTNGELFQF